MANIDYFWRKATEYTQRAEETTDEEVRTFFYRLRDAWIAAANRVEMIEAVDADAATAGGYYSDGDGVNSPENFLSSIAGIVKIKESNPTMLVNGHAKFQRS